jgi:hypothetical protein
VFVSCGFVQWFVCRGPFDTLMMFMATVSVGSMCMTSSVVIVPIGYV